MEDPAFEVDLLLSAYGGQAADLSLSILVWATSVTSSQNTQTEVSGATRFGERQ